VLIIFYIFGYMKKHIQESLRVSKLIKAESKQCWFNARKAIMKVPKYAQSTYVEGHIVLHRTLVIEHAWIAKDGVIIDPTLPTDICLYCPGIRIHGREGIEAFLSTDDGKAVKSMPFFCAYGYGGHQHAGFRQSLRDGTAISATFSNRDMSLNHDQRTALLNAGISIEHVDVLKQGHLSDLFHENLVLK